MWGNLCRHSGKEAVSNQSRWSFHHHWMLETPRSNKTGLPEVFSPVDFLPHVLRIEGFLPNTTFDWPSIQVPQDTCGTRRGLNNHRRNRPLHPTPRWTYLTSLLPRFSPASPTTRARPFEAPATCHAYICRMFVLRCTCLFASP